MKQVPKSEHITPKHHSDALEEDKINILLGFYGHTLTICKYCGWHHHKTYVCSCGVDEGYLEDENHKTVIPLVEVFVVPD